MRASLVDLSVLAGASLLLGESLEAVSHVGGPASLVGHLGHEQRARLDVPGDPQGPDVHGVEARVVDQPRATILAAASSPQ